ncbi:MAG: acetyl-CoA carboxylase biotin carboxylase subunit, partial [Candidatus Aminicenantes bacterium]|nr:acetyl-CoA carboxylase biotin carboxylase subunit [Candidatus Aminicenantes bacterium]
PLSEAPVPRQGASMECRIYAEDPTNNFLPSPGLIKGLTDPGGPGVRNDSGVYVGATISMEYDPMISKLIVWGNDRQQVLNRMLRALEEFRILGIRTNIFYLRKIISHPRFISGDYDTLFIPTYGKELLKSTDSGDEPVALSAAAVLSLIEKEKTKVADNQNQSESSNWKRLNRNWKFQG